MYTARSTRKLKDVLCQSCCETYDDMLRHCIKLLHLLLVATIIVTAIQANLARVCKGLS